MYRTLITLPLALLILAGCPGEEPNLNSTNAAVSGDDDDSEACEAEYEAAEACWDANPEDWDACEAEDEALFACWDEHPDADCEDDWGDDDEWGDDDDSADWEDEIPEECEDELEAADACWDGLDEDASDEAVDACIELEDALAECAGWDEEVEPLPADEEPPADD